MLSDERLSDGELEECIARAEARKRLPYALVVLALREIQSRRAREAEAREGLTLTTQSHEMCNTVQVRNADGECLATGFGPGSISGVQVGVNVGEDDFEAMWGLTIVQARQWSEAVLMACDEADKLAGGEA